MEANHEYLAEPRLQEGKEGRRPREARKTLGHRRNETSGGLVAKGYRGRPRSIIRESESSAGMGLIFWGSEDKAADRGGFVTGPAGLGNAR